MIGAVILGSIILFVTSLTFYVIFISRPTGALKKLKLKSKNKKRNMQPVALVVMFFVIVMSAVMLYPLACIGLIDKITEQEIIITQDQDQDQDILTILTLYTRLKQAKDVQECRSIISAFHTVLERMKQNDKYDQHALYATSEALKQVEESINQLEQSEDYVLYRIINGEIDYKDYINSAGDYGRVTVVNYGTAMVGNYGTATAGDHGIATAGNWGTAIAGDQGMATAGIGGKASAGKAGMIDIAYYDAQGRKQWVTGYVGENGIQPNVLYRADNTGKLIPVH